MTRFIYFRVWESAFQYFVQQGAYLYKKRNALEILICGQQDM